MKSITAAALALAGAFGMVPGAMAQEQVQVGGTAEKLCTLPATWSFVSGAAGANAATWSGTTWTIPQAQFANANASAVAGSEYAIRVRGPGFCNTSHTIAVSSARGGLTNGDASTAAPSGFAKRRPVKYEAYWSNGAGGSFGPGPSLTASTPGQSVSRTYTVSGSQPPPGNRDFDIRLGLSRPTIAQPLVAGAYSDTVTVTIALVP